MVAPNSNDFANYLSYFSLVGSGTSLGLGLGFALTSDAFHGLAFTVLPPAFGLLWINILQTNKFVL